jgi:hypothetical protein
MLHEALTYSQDVEVSKWDFALEIKSLRSERVTDSDLRWLSCKGYVEHADETTLPTQDRRSFRPSGNFTLSENSCFVLTEDGLRIAQQILNGSPTSFPHVADRDAAESNGKPARGGTTGEPASGEVVWDVKRRELRVGTQLIKRFRVPAPNQESILSAFQEEGWPPRIDDPLSQAPGIYPKQRLHAAINSLNRNQKITLLRFRGDGNGSGICWEFKSQVES